MGKRLTDKTSPATQLVTAGRRPEWTGPVVNPPVWRASTVLYEDTAALAEGARAMPTAASSMAAAARRRNGRWPKR